MKNLLTISIIIFVLLLIPCFYLQASLNTEQTSVLNKIGEKSGYGEEVYPSAKVETKLATKIGNIANVVLGAMGVVFLFFVVFSGVQWMTAGGNEENINKAKKRINRASIGLAIIILSYAIATTITNVIIK